MNINSIDIIIPVFKPGESFSLLIEMLKKQSVPFEKLIIFITDPAKEVTRDAGDYGMGDEESKVHGGNLRTSSDKEKQDAIEVRILKAFAGEEERLIIRHIREKEFDHAGTRKKAVELSKADAFICMTDDAVPADTLLIEKLKGALSRDERIALAYARQLANQDASEAEKYTRHFNYPAQSIIKSNRDLEKYGIKTYFASNVCCAYSRNIYEKLGGFTDFSIFNEDMIYAATALKAGYFSYYKADAMVYHSHNLSPTQEFGRSFDQGISQAMHPEIFGDIRSENEGIRYVWETFSHLLAGGHIIAAAGFVYSSGLRYAGYRLGRDFKRLPGKLVYNLSTNKNFVKQHLLVRDRI